MSMTTGEMEEWIKHQIKTSWEQSDEKKQIDKLKPILAIVGVLMVAIGVFALAFVDNRKYVSQSLLPFLGIGAFAVTFLGPIVLYSVYGSREAKARKVAEDRVRQLRAADLREEERKFAEAATQKQDIDFAHLWVLNQKRIDYYHDIAITQARSSFRSGQIATIAGFIGVIVLGAIAATTTGASAVSVGAVGVAGAALSGYIGSTFMKAQADASAQLRQFFAQPVEFARLLGAERLLDSMDSTSRSKVVQTIVNATVNPGVQIPGENTEIEVKPKKKWYLPWKK